MSYAYDNLRRYWDREEAIYEARRRDLERWQERIVETVVNSLRERTAEKERAK